MSKPRRFIAHDLIEDSAGNFIEYSAYQNLLALSGGLKRALEKHHNWHLEFTEVPKEFVGLNMAAEYCDSSMYDETLGAIDAYDKGMEQHGK